MKHNNSLFVLIGIIILSFQFTIQAQTYQTLPDSNVTWIVTESSSSGTFHIEYGLSTFSDDTLINSNNYKKIFLRWSPQFYEYAGAYRNNSNGKTFYVPPLSDTTEYLLHDFSKNAGDTIKGVALNHPNHQFIGTYDLIVDSIQYKNSGPHNLKCLFLSPIPPHPPYYNGNQIVWVEGIGCLNGGIFNQYLCGLAMISLRCMSTDDTIFYFSPLSSCWFPQGITLSYDSGVCELPLVSINETVPEYNQTIIYPNPFSDYILIEYPPSPPFEITIFNLLGQKIFFRSYSSIEGRQLTIVLNLKPSLYLIRLLSKNNEIITKKLIKK